MQAGVSCQRFEAGGAVLGHAFQQAYHAVDYLDVGFIGHIGNATVFHIVKSILYCEILFFLLR